MDGSSGDVTVLLRQIRDGNTTAAEELIPLILAELRALARRQLRSERSEHTLQPTALVHEAYLRLVGDQSRDWQSRAHFIGVSVSIMRRILIDHARRKQALKRGGHDEITFQVDDCAGFTYEKADELIALDVALERLERFSAR
jgi:RNA polymerase sigma-70 factor, ECF subfamily